MLDPQSNNQQTTATPEVLPQQTTAAESAEPVSSKTLQTALTDSKNKANAHFITQNRNCDQLSLIKAPTINA